MPHALLLQKPAIPTVAAKTLARHARTVARVLLGLVFFVFGLNYFLELLPPPSSPIPDGAAALAFALMKAGYLFPLIKGTEVLAGALLLANRFVPLALALIAPVIVNIVAFHAFLAPSGLGLAVGLVVLEVALAWGYRAAFRGMLVARAR
jgi:hypothetical protein